jgi:ABC-type nitrate/sulfonate/bicarbonate transport system substrate-binding protein
MSTPRPLYQLLLVLAVLSATACGTRAQAAATPPLVATPVREAVPVAEAPPAPSAVAPANTARTYQPTPLSPPVTMKVGTINATADAAIFIAMEKGYFRDEGIEIELQEFATSALMIPPLATGQLDVATGAVAAATFNVAVREVPLRIVADKGSTPGPDWDFVLL